MTLVSTSAVAEQLGIHRVSAAALVRAGRIPAVKVANRWVVEERALKQFAATYVKGPGRKKKLGT